MELTSDVSPRYHSHYNPVSSSSLPPLVADPYVKVEMYVNGMREGKAKCKVRQNTQDPVWHHQVVFEINRENPKLLGHVFVFHVLHKDMMTGVHKIGQVGFSSNSRLDVIFYG